MTRLGWKILPDGMYRVALPQLSEEEEEIVGDIIELFREESRTSIFEIPSQVRERIMALLDYYAEEHHLILDDAQRAYLGEIAFSYVWSFGPFDALLSDDDLEEIAVIGIGKPVFVYHRERGWLSTNIVVTSEAAFIILVNKMARTIGRRITFQTPRLNAILPDGSRLHASIPPISHCELTIRKFRKEPCSPLFLLSHGTISAEALAFLWLAMKVDASLLIAGNTASGKTTTLNALLSFVPSADRILIIEETPEINVPHEHVIRLLSSEETHITMRELIWDSLRMRPDRVVVGEVRTKAEADAFIETVLSGQARGSYATFHAQSTEDAVNRLRNFQILPIDVASLDAIIVQRRMVTYKSAETGTEIRRILEISELRKQKHDVEVVPIFSYDPTTDTLHRVREYRESRLATALCRAFSVSPEELSTMITHRAAFLTSLKERTLSYREFQEYVKAWEHRSLSEERVASPEAHLVKEEHTPPRG